MSRKRQASIVSGGIAALAHSIRAGVMEYALNRKSDPYRCPYETYVTGSPVFIHEESTRFPPR